MPSKDTDKIIEELRKKAQSIEFDKKKTKIDKKATLELARKIRQSLNEEGNLSSPNLSRA